MTYLECEKPIIRCILLIDDEAPLCVAVKALLERHGYQVDTALNGAAGLRLLDEKKFDLVITDIYMDGIDGLQVLSHLRRSFRGLPVIAISGGTPKLRFDPLIVAKQLGAVALLSKPITIEELLRSIRQVDNLAGDESEAAPAC